MQGQATKLDLLDVEGLDILDLLDNFWAEDFYTGKMKANKPYICETQARN